MPALQLVGDQNRNESVWSQLSGTIDGDFDEMRHYRQFVANENRNE